MLKQPSGGRSIEVHVDPITIVASDPEVLKILKSLQSQGAKLMSSVEDLSAGLTSVSDAVTQQGVDLAELSTAVDELGARIDALGNPDLSAQLATVQDILGRVTTSSADLDAQTSEIAGLAQPPAPPAP